MAILSLYTVLSLCSMHLLSPTIPSHHFPVRRLTTQDPHLPIKAPTAPVSIDSPNAASKAHARHSEMNGTVVGSTTYWTGRHE